MNILFLLFCPKWLIAKLFVFKADVLSTSSRIDLSHDCIWSHWKVSLK